MAKQIYGVSKNHDLDPSLIKPDVRPLMQRIRQLMTEKSSIIFNMIAILMSSIMVLNIFQAIFGSSSKGPLISYYLLDILFVIAVAIFFLFKGKEAEFLFREGLDVGAGEEWDADKGLIYLGNDNSDSRAINFAADDVKTHFLVMGSTGSGKSRFLLGILYQSLLIGSGCCYVDGKGDNTVWWLVYSFCRRVGREDDLLILNYLTGSETPEVPSPFDHQLSNTTNPFSYGTADNLNSLIVGLMREAGGDGAMWKGRARTMLKGLLSALCYKRDKYGMLLDINIIRDYFPLDKIIALSRDPDLKSSAKDPLRKYLLDLPGFTEESVLTGEISGKAYEQHNFLTMQLTEVMSDLSETYGKIFGVPLGEIDFKDVLFNRRILFCLLPSLEKDPDALEGLGKLVVAGLRSALAPALGAKAEGTKREVIDTKPTSSKVPFFIILDEYGYYAVQGFAVVAAQARSLGVSVLFAGQDIPSLKKASEEEAKATIANTNIKICMKLEDPDDTAQVYTKRAGQANVAKSDHHDYGMFSYKVKGETRLQTEDIVNVRDLVDQDPGEAHVIYRNILSRCRFFYYEPHQVSEAKLNKFIMVNKPKEAVIKKLIGATTTLDNLFIKNKPQKASPKTKDTGLRNLFSDVELSSSINGQTPLDSAVTALGMIEVRTKLKSIKLDDKSSSSITIDSDDAEELRDIADSYLENELGEDNDIDKEVDKSETEKFVDEIDDEFDENNPLNSLFDSLNGLDDDELNEIFSGFEDESMKDQASAVSDEFSKLLDESVISTAKKQGFDDKEIKSASQQLAEDMEPEKVESSFNMLGKTNEYPTTPTPNKLGQEEINKNIQDMLDQLDDSNSKIN